MSAQAHLERHGVGRGDLFLFFGWFHKVCEENGRWSYVPNAPDLHVLFGWLDVAEVVPIAEQWTAKPKWAAGHPHFHDHSAKNNTLYVSRAIGEGGIGAGTFDRYQRGLQLSAGGPRRSRWQLPAWFNPEGCASILSFHSSNSRWQKAQTGVLLDAVGRGQEFVLDGERYPEAEPWARGLIDGTA